MRKQKSIDIKELNEILFQNGQKLTILKLIRLRQRHASSIYKIELSNGLIFDGKKQFYCVLNKKFVKNFDYIFQDEFYNKRIEAFEKERRLLASSKGGKKSQELHGEKIKNNLNTGIPWNVGMTGIQCNRNITDEMRKIYSETMTRTNLSFTKEKRKEMALNHSESMKRKILSGEYTPKSENLLNHTRMVYKDKKFRSSWEIIFYAMNENLSYESLRILYFDSVKEKNRVYIIDFCDYEKNIVYEIKPKRFQNTQNFKDKLKSLVNWCDEHNYQFIIIDEDYFKNNGEIIMKLHLDEDVKKKVYKICQK